MAQFSFNEYSPSLSAKVTAEEVFNKIWDLNPQENIVTIDLSQMVAMTTICARVIFGALYLRLGKDSFNRHIIFNGMSDTLRIVINWGIESAIESGID